MPSRVPFLHRLCWQVPAANLSKFFKFAIPPRQVLTRWAMVAHVWWAGTLELRNSVALRGWIPPCRRGFPKRAVHRDVLPPPVRMAALCGAGSLQPLRLFARRIRHHQLDDRCAPASHPIFQRIMCLILTPGGPTPSEMFDSFLSQVRL